MPRRKPGTLLTLEVEILDAALELRETGSDTFHGFALATTLRERAGARSLTAHGTLYKALGRLDDRGLLTSHWEDPSAVAGRPRRRLYALTGKGASVATQARSAANQQPPRPVRVAPEAA